MCVKGYCTHFNNITFTFYSVFLLQTFDEASEQALS